MDPGPFTLRDLDWMAKGKRFDEWDRTSLVAQLIHNDPWGSRKWLPVTAFNPFSTTPRKKIKGRITDPRLAVEPGDIVTIVK